MCAVFGLVQFGSFNELEGKKIRDYIGEVLKSRGPDGSWYYDSEGVSFGMHRLSVRCDEDPYEPMKFDGLVCSYNGEIYSTLNAQGVPKLLVNGGLEEVETILSDSKDSGLDGMYALCVWDEANERLSLYRDNWGIKPLFYTQNKYHFLFSSELKGIIAAQGEVSLDRSSLADLFCFGWPLNNSSIIEGVKELIPGTVASTNFKNQGLIVNPIKPYDFSRSDYLSSMSIRKRIQASIRQSLVGKEKVGLALSGGLDSSILAFELNAMGIENIETFSVVVEEGKDGVRNLNELGLPKGGKWEKWEHTTIEFSKAEFSYYLTKSTQTFCYPTTMSSIPLYYKLAETVSESGIRVLLLGEGVDELFFGYQSHLVFNSNTVTLENFYLKDSLDYLEDLFGETLIEERIDFFRERYVKNISRMEGLRRSQIDLRLMRLLYRADSLLMGLGVEGRLPFMHLGIPELALTFSSDQLLGKETKEILRRAYSGLLPSSRDKKVRFKLDNDFLREVIKSPEIADLILYSDDSLDSILSIDGRKKLYNNFVNDSHFRIDLLFLTLTTVLFFKETQKLVRKTNSPARVDR